MVAKTTLDVENSVALGGEVESVWQLKAPHEVAAGFRDRSSSPLPTPLKPHVSISGKRMFCQIEINTQVII